MSRRGTIAFAFVCIGLLGLVRSSRAASVGVGGGGAPNSSNLHVLIEGSKQGAFKGDCTTAADKQKICAVAFHFGAHVATSSTGQVSGRRQYDALVITKRIGDASVQEFQALATNEAIRAVTLEIWQSDADGTQSLAYRIKLQNAVVTSLTQAEEPGATGVAGGPVENVGFAFSKITVDTGRFVASDGR